MMRLASSGDTEAEKIFKEVQERVKLYAKARGESEVSETVLREISRDGSRDEILEARAQASASSQIRIAAHNALIASLDRFEKECYKKSLDTQWRKILGESREAIGVWAERVAPYL
jgi:hypothetical protein